LVKSLGIFIGGLIAFCVANYVEAPMVYYLYDHPVVWFRDFMAQSVFEGGLIGGSDFGVIFAIVCFIDWLMRKRGKQIFTHFTDLELRFIWSSSLITSIITVHSLKWIVSRARPKMIFTPDFISQPDSFGLIHNMTWTGFLPWDGPRGYSFNSLPSGHAASCAILLTVAYIFWGKRQKIGMTIFSLITIFSALMAVGRSMAGMHWLSDGIASYFICWFVIQIMATRMCLFDQQR
jgi:membrane-associated phospholipid phosphatase